MNAAMVEAAFLIHRDKSHRLEYGFEGYCTVDLKSERVINIHSLGNRWFEEYTLYSTWRAD